METICLTGSSGYIASWILRMLLEEGHTVHATVRDEKSPSCAHVISKEALGLPADCPGTLKIFSGCDLLAAGSFDEAMNGCTVCIHTASPFLIDHAKQDPQKNLIEPALMGTENVLNSVNKSGTIKRVVLTASVVSVAAGNVRKPGNAPFTEDDWNLTDTIETGPYPLSKRLAEQKAWEMAKAQDTWTLVTIHPGFVMGPLLSSRVNDGSISFMKKVLGGVMFASPNLQFGVVDVRDVAKAHILGMKAETPGRYLCVENSYYLNQIGQFLRPKYGSKFPFLPKLAIPDFMSKMFVPLLSQYSRKDLEANLSVPLIFDNSKIKKEFKMEFIPAETTFNDMVASMIERKIA